MGLRAYSFTYDDLSRIKDARHLEFANGSWQNTNKYNESVNEYDDSGNIKKLVRRGFKMPNYSIGIIDDLTYTYNGNKVIAVDDSVVVNNGNDFCDNGQYFNGTDPEYEYDMNGNMIKDVNKGIVSITYNHLNLPVSIEKTNGNRV